MFFGTGFSATKLKPQLKMAVNRIQIASNKKAALLKQNMREVAIMLSEDPPKEEKAKIRAEALIRDDNVIEAYEILQLQCELLHERIKLLEYSKECPPDLVPVVSTLIWAAHRVDIPELMMIRKQFCAKYGKKFEQDALQNTNGVLNERVVNKLSVHPPAAYLVQTYLERICEQFEVNWTPKVKLSTNEMIEPMAAPVGYSVQVAQGTGLGSSIGDGPPQPHGPGGTIPPPIVSAEPYDPNNGIPPPAPGHGHGNHMGGKQSDFEEVDIFVPGAPSAPPGSTLTSPSNTTIASQQTTQQHHNQQQQNKKDDDDDDNNNNVPPPAPSGGGGGGGGGHGTSNGVGASYADLAARFDQLKK